MEHRGKRPIPVTVIAVLATLAGVCALLVGSALLVGAAVPRVGEETNAAPAVLVYLGLWSAGGGVCQVVGGFFAFRGAGWARILLTVVLVVHVLLHGVIAATGHQSAGSAIFVAIFAALAVALLWSRSATAWFTRRVPVT